MQNKTSGLPDSEFTSFQPATQMLSVGSHGIMDGLKTGAWDQALTLCLKFQLSLAPSPFPITLLFSTFHSLAHYVILLICLIY